MLRQRRLLAGLALAFASCTTDVVQCAEVATAQARGASSSSTTPAANPQNCSERSRAGGTTAGGSGAVDTGAEAGTRGGAKKADAKKTTVCPPVDPDTNTGTRGGEPSKPLSFAR